MHGIPELNSKGLREFGLVTGGIVAILFGALLPWLFGLKYPLWPWVIGVILALWALLAPRSLKPVYQWWMRFGLLLSRITTPIILGVVFFLVIAPIGMIMRLFRRDPMARRIDEKVDSFRVNSRQPPKDHMEKPF
ncbi:MAG: SxtJ family membrane protein [Pseudomonadota bacterium]